MTSRMTQLTGSSCLHQLFERCASEDPARIAAIDCQGSEPYESIDLAANRLGHYLQQLGVGPDLPVGICLESDRQRVIGILGVLKAGGCYLPLAPDYPFERLEYMLQDAGAPVLLTASHLVERLPASAARIVCLDTEAEAISSGPDIRPSSAVTPENLAYVIYTSGSTGAPKGIAVRHRGVANNLLDLIDRFAIGGGDRCLALSSLSFDMCVFEILGMLAAGATIILPESKRVKDPSHWADLIERHRVTVWNSAPALLEMLVDHLALRRDEKLQSLRLALLGGDWIPVSLPDRLRELAPDVEVVSLGGATEASIHSTIYSVGQVDLAWPSIPYGRPMANQSTYILDPRLQQVGMGESGELYLGGVGLARGYLDRPGQTAERFLPDPYSTVPGSRMYRTGDRVRCKSDGEIELLGRVDFQVKIRGHRIELREIESVLQAHSLVADAVVVGAGEASDKRLVAYVVPSLSEGRSKEASRRELDHWRAVYDETYSSAGPEPVDRDFSGWVSSFSGEPFPREELDEVVDSTLERIRTLAARNVLEIGCGTGLLLLELASQCERYDASDLSPAALTSIRRQIEDRGLELPGLSLEQRFADDFSGVTDGAYDLVLINSVAQHFPSVAYLLQVLEGSVRALRPGGFIFLGDVRCLPLLTAFHTAIELATASEDTPLAELERRVDRRLRQEKELWLDPLLYPRLRDLLPEVSGVEVRLRRSRHQNEMSLFHHDILLQVAGGESEADNSTLDHDGAGVDVASLRRHLLDSSTDGLILRDVADVRIATVIAAARRLRDPGSLTTVRELRSWLDHRSTPGAVPEELWQLGEELDWSVELVWPRSGEAGNLDAILRRQHRSPEPADESPTQPSKVRLLRPTIASEKESGSVDWEDLGNRPQTAGGVDLVPELRRSLRTSLPDFMVPAEFVVLDSIPLSPNGKVDRRALPPPGTSRVDLGAKYQAPVSPFEQVVAGIWSDVLDVHPLGTLDDFYELGGHSLSATRIVSRVNDTFSMEVPLAAFFEHPNVTAFGELVRVLARRAGIDVDSVAEVVMEVDRLSDDEVERALAEADDLNTEAEAS